jgi:hypothetical protein
MGHADLIHKLEPLPSAQRVAVGNLVEAPAAGCDVKDVSTKVESAIDGQMR